MRPDKLRASFPENSRTITHLQIKLNKITESLQNTKGFERHEQAKNIRDTRTTHLLYL